MDNLQTQNNLIDLLGSARNIAVVPSKVPGFDAFAAGVGLYYLLSTLEKTDVKLVYSGSIPSGGENIIEPEKITTNIFQKELIIDINYSNTPAAKVHYSTKDDVLHLSLGPVDKDFSLSERVKTYIRGFDFDVIVTIGAQYLEDLGQIYNEMRDVFKKSRIVNIDNVGRNSRFGELNIVDAQSESLSLMVLNLAKDLNLNLNKNSAKALLAQISK